MRRHHLVLPFVMIAVVALPEVATVIGDTVLQDEESQTVEDVKGVLKAQEKAWNDGDIPGFMDGYVRSDDLRFASGDSITTGWQATLERYQARYTDRDTMGTLEFKDLKVLPLSESYAEVFGGWYLTRKADKGDASGLFTLLMKKTPGGWRVLHDHTSAAEKK